MPELTEHSPKPEIHCAIIFHHVRECDTLTFDVSKGLSDLPLSFDQLIKSIYL